MIVIIRADASEEQVGAIVARAIALGLSHHLSRGAERAILILSGDDAAQLEQQFASLPGVDRLTPLTRPFRLASREVHSQDTLVQVSGVVIGAGSPVIVAGSSSVVADAEAAETARQLRAAGANLIRTGVYRPIDNLFGAPQLDPQALQRLESVRRDSGLPVATEVLAAEHVPAIARHADLLIITGAQMQARPLLQACGWSNRPIMLQRSESAQVQEWLQAADHLLAGGNRQVILCEQGIRTYETNVRHTLDISAVPLVRRVSHLPIMVGPAPGAGQRFMIEPLALAAIAAGAHGLLLEVHPPGGPASEGDWALDFVQLAGLAERVRVLTAALNVETTDAGD